MERYLKKTMGLFGKAHAQLMRKRVFLNGNLYEYIGIGFLFIVITLFLTNFTVLQGNTKLFVDGPGDGTAGFLWFNTVEADPNPVLGHTDMANYPEGEELFNPTQVTYTLVWTPLWILSKIFGPVMGLNIVTFLGIFLCAIIMYWLVKRLTSNPYVAVFAGYAAAFTPYHLVKSSSHLTYIFSVVFVLILAAFIGYWRRPSTKRAVLFALTIAVAFYTDGYFILIGSIFTVCLILAGFIHDALRKTIKSTLVIRLKHAGIIIGVLALAVVPIGVTQLSQGSGVDKFLSGARGSIQFDIEHYSTRPIDFFMPSTINPFFSQDETFKSVAELQNTRSNTSENNTYIGYVLLILSAIGLVLFIYNALFPKKSFLNVKKYPYIENYKLVYVISFISIPVLVWCMLSPSLTLFGQPLIVLSDILLAHDISLWRVMARFYLPLHVVFVVAASFALAALTYPLFNDKGTKKNRNKGRVKYGIGALIIFLSLALTSIEYSTALSGISYNFDNIPKIYSQIRDDKEIKVIAELPLMDRPLSTNYDFATAQIVHGKKLVNTPLTNTVPGTRTALGTSIEAVDYAIQRGADTIITHNISCRNDKAWGSLKYTDENLSGTMEASYYGSPICVYSVNKSYAPDEFFVKLKYGTFSDAPYIGNDFKEYQSLYMEDGWLNVVDSRGSVPKQGYASFRADIQYTPGLKKEDSTSWHLYQEDSLIASGSISDQIIIERLDVTKQIHVKVISSGAPIDKPFMISLSDIVVTKTN